MKPTLLYYLLFITVTSFAQKPFFQTVKVGGYVLFDNFHMDKKDWQAARLSTATQLTQSVDSLQEFHPKDYNFFGPVTGVGSRMSLQHDWIIGEQGRRKLIWSTGLGYHNSTTSSGIFSYYPYYQLSDTTKTYREEVLTFELQQRYIDVYNSFSHEIQLKTAPGLSLSIGLALQLSFPLTSNITEAYSSAPVQWSIAQRRWQQSANYAKSSLVSAARKPVVFSWSIPVGLGIRCSKKISVMSNVEYFKSSRTPSLTAKKQSTGTTLLGLSFIYSLM